MKVAIVHDWMTGMRGGEAILDVICELYPKADLYALLWTDKTMSPNILNGRKIHTSYLQSLMQFSSFQKNYRKLLPLFPHAISKFDLSQYDLVLSNTHCVAKGVHVNKKALHVAYVSTPMRYIWDLFDDYFGPGKVGLATRLAANIVRKPLQRWDVSSNNNVNFFLANSNFVKQRIEKFWKRDATVLYPFVEHKRFYPIKNQNELGNFYLIVSAFAPYKRIDLAIAAFKKNKLSLKIVGKGQDEDHLRMLARGVPTIEFLGGIPNSEIEKLYRTAKALIFPGVEDFGITPLESMCSGRPVIALNQGGACETVTEKTGLLFPEQTVESLQEAIDVFESGKIQFNSDDCVARAMQFSREKFKQGYSHFIEHCMQAKFGAQ